MKLDQVSRTPKAQEVKKIYEAPRLHDLGDAVAQTKGAEGNIADGACGARQIRGYGF
ncbi:MAG TPA: hypothetical protein VNO21_05305 [Polyangiaceae bacterium]|nr:hypothetical protein [Polyangiaceae bacterium]